jgi:NADP-dependent 3-hydroxy acid dehydrogenase YdfG
MQQPSSPSNISLQNQVALITGASKGIGTAIAKRLAQEGIHLVLSARSQAPLEALANEIKAAHPHVQVLVVPTDVSNPESVKALVEKSLQTFQKIDILINNAGIAGKIALLQEVSIDEINKTIDTNLKGPIYLMKYVLPGMIAQQHGTIININSVAGKTAFPYWSIYDASKFGLHAITASVAEEQASNHIKVVGIYPGAVDTPIWDTIELNHPTNRDGMLDAETVADTVFYVLNQPQKVFIPEIILKPLQPAL